MISIGDQIGDFVVEAEIGRGGMGIVYRARHLPERRAVAVKVLRPELVHHPGIVRRFFREVLAVRTVNHPNVVKYIDTGLWGTQSYIVFELLDGRPLSGLIGPGMPLDTTWVVHLVMHVAKGLDAVHAKDIVHRDLNPSNVLLAREGPGRARAVIIDFGVAKLADSVFGISSERMELGTLSYQAPEQEHDSRNVDLRADIYSLAVMTFQMLAHGQLPWGRGAPAEIMYRRRLDPVPDLRALAPNLSAEQVDVLQRGMAEDHWRRWTSASAFAAALADSSGVATADPDFLDVLLTLVDSTSQPSAQAGATSPTPPLATTRPAPRRGPQSRR